MRTWGRHWIWLCMCWLCCPIRVHNASFAQVADARSSIAAAALLRSTVSKLGKTDSGNAYTVFKDVLYPGAAGEQTADVYLPEKEFEAPRPALLVIHGGGWFAGDKGGTRQLELAQLAIDEGYVAVSINYSLTKFAGGNPRAQKLRAGWPNNLFDCKCALRWMKQHALALGIDADRIAVAGGSAGGHLALMLGLSARHETLNEMGGFQKNDTAVSCIIDFYGATNLQNFEVYSLFSEHDRYDLKMHALASPVEHVCKDSPPMLILQGSLDNDVEPVHSDELAAKARLLGVVCEYVLVEGAGHGFGLRAGRRDLRQIGRAHV